MSVGKQTVSGRLWRQRGDTLVEVLISIAVVSLVLGGAYVTTRTSLEATRATQERSNALKLGQSQLEQLKGVVASNPAAVFGGAAPSPFCITSTNAVVAASNSACAVDTTGTATTTEPVFHLSVARSSNQFTLTETWTDVSGHATDQLVLIYRVYQ